MDIIDAINKSDSKIKYDLFIKLLNGLVNFTNYVEQLFTTEMSKHNDIFTVFQKYKNGNNIFSNI